MRYTPTRVMILEECCGFMAGTEPQVRDESKGLCAAGSGAETHGTLDKPDLLGSLADNSNKNSHPPGKGATISACKLFLNLKSSWRHMETVHVCACARVCPGGAFLPIHLLLLTRSGCAPAETKPSRCRCSPALVQRPCYPECACTLRACCRGRLQPLSVNINTSLARCTHA